MGRREVIQTGDKVRGNRFAALPECENISFSLSGRENIPSPSDAFDILDVPSLEIWLTALDIVQADLTDVVSWTDRAFGKILSVNDTLQPGKTFRYRTNILNGQGVVRTLDDTIGFGPVSFVLSVADSAPLRVGVFTAVTVARVFGNVLNSGTAPIGVVDNGVNDGWQHHGYGGGGLAGTPRGYSINADVMAQVNYVGDQNQNWGVRSTIRDATSFRAYLNGTLLQNAGVAAIGAQAATTVLNIGCGMGQGDGAAFTCDTEGQPPTMDYAEIALFSGALDDSTRASVEDFLAARWGL